MSEMNEKDLAQVSGGAADSKNNESPWNCFVQKNCSNCSIKGSETCQQAMAKYRSVIENPAVPDEAKKLIFCMYRQ